MAFTVFRRLARSAVMAAVMLTASPWLRAQDTDLAGLRRQAAALVREKNYAEALPLLERIVATDPNAGEWNFNLGLALASTAQGSGDPERTAAMRVRARTLFLKARELGFQHPMLEAFIGSIPPDGAERTSFSANADVDRLMAEGEQLFAAQKMDEALTKYQRALQLEPTLYEAALFCGDVYLQRADYPEAEVWYQKAIAIDPTRESAYRFSATPLMRQGRYNDALARYVEAYITEPYNRATSGGLGQWAQVTRAELAHPEIAVPGSPATCDRPPCRTLALEAAALRAATSTATSDGGGARTSSDVELIKQLDREELLEPYILLARADEGIARDHPAYLREHRERLRRYVMAYVVRRSAAR